VLTVCLCLKNSTFNWKCSKEKIGGIIVLLCQEHKFPVSFSFYLYNVWLSFLVYNSFSSSNSLLFCRTELNLVFMCSCLFEETGLLPRGYQLQCVVLIWGGRRRGQIRASEGTIRWGRREWRKGQGEAPDGSGDVVATAEGSPSKLQCTSLSAPFCLVGATGTCSIPFSRRCQRLQNSA
jgi:hypothetical protein